MLTDRTRRTMTYASRGLKEAEKNSEDGKEHTYLHKGRKEGAAASHTRPTHTRQQPLPLHSHNNGEHVLKGNAMLCPRR